MNRLIFIMLCCFISLTSTAQTIQDLMDEIEQTKLETTLNEFSGEISTTVGGNTVTILNRQHANNGIAGDYLIEEFDSMNNITVVGQNFNTTGRNIIATQLGKTNPDDIYIISAHYDTVANYCADDNATGTTAVLEIARILSNQCFDNTIIYALWDEEEIGLNGSEFYADLANTNNDNILGVLNMDMMGYDGDAPGQPGDNEFDIDFRSSIPNTVAMKNDILAVLNAYTFDLEVVEVPNGTFASDHASFWFNGFPAVLVGESWETNDQTPFYHTSGDRTNTLDLPYFTEMTKLVLGWTATKASLLSIDNSVNQTPTMLTANQNSATYQWYDCDTESMIAGATGQSYIPTSNGTYQVAVTIGNCTEYSNCLVFDTLSTETFEQGDIDVFPNPATDVLNVKSVLHSDISLVLYNVSGKIVLERISGNELTQLDISNLANGLYFLNASTEDKSGTFKVVKE